MQGNLTTSAALRQTRSDWEGIAKWAELYDLITPRPFDQNTLLDMREQFARSGYVKLKSFLNSTALDAFRSEMEELEQLSARRQFEMPGYLTPRRLSVLGGGAIKAQSPFLYSLYHHYAFRTCIESIVGRPVYTCSHPEEYMVANFLHNSGDTHGWHLDDPAYALVIFAEAPDAGCGGEVEMIANWTDLCQRKNQKPDENVMELVSWAMQNGLVDRHNHQSGDAYLLRADMNLHRVTPLLQKGMRRTVVNLAFQSKPEACYGNTADLLYSSGVA